MERGENLVPPGLSEDPVFRYKKGRDSSYGSHKCTLLVEIFHWLFVASVAYENFFWSQSRLA